MEKPKLEWHELVTNLSRTWYEPSTNFTFEKSPSCSYLCFQTPLRHVAGQVRGADRLPHEVPRPPLPQEVAGQHERRATAEGLTCSRSASRARAAHPRRAHGKTNIEPFLGFTNCLLLYCISRRTK